MTLILAWGLRRQSSLGRRFRTTRAGAALALVAAEVGREDEAMPEVAEEKPTMLTDEICLIPGDAPVVRVEDAPGNARRIFTGVDIQAKVEDVWDVLTDYAMLEQVVPNLVHNEIVERYEDGNARLWQIGRASWQIFGKNLYFQAGTTLDIRLYPEGLPEERISGDYMCASKMTSAEVRAMGRGLKLRRGIFPRPFSIATDGVPVLDITMQNVPGEKGDFVHYQGVWRMQPLQGCAPEGEDMTRLTFAVECEPHWFLPVAPVEGRIATALVQNMEAIRDFVQQEDAKKKQEAQAHAAHEAGEAATVSGALPAGRLRSPTATAGRGCMAGQRPRKRATGASSRRASAVELEAMVDAMLENLERIEAGSAYDVAASAGAEAPTALATLSEMVMGLEAEALLGASAVAAAAAVASSWSKKERVQTEKELMIIAKSVDVAGDEYTSRAWRAICCQHPMAVKEQEFLGEPLTRAEVGRRWPKLVKALGISKEEVLEIIEVDSTPLLVDSESVAEVLARLTQISSREKALELINWNPSLLVGGRKNGEEQSLHVQVLGDVLYAGRIVKVLQEDGRDDAAKVMEIELYSYAMSIIKPLVQMAQRGRIDESNDALCRRPLKMAAQVVPNDSIRVFFSRMADAENPWRWLMDQAFAGVDVMRGLVQRPAHLGTILPHYDGILPHVPSIYTRLSVLRPHIPSIVRILDPYFRQVEPHLDRIMDRMDKIEPHLPYILLHLDVLAKHCGVLLDHFDDLIPYASIKREVTLEDLSACCEAGDELACDVMDEVAYEMRRDRTIELETDNESYLPRLLPYVDFLVPRLDELAPHLPLVHPHLPHILPYLDQLLPYIPRFARHPKASANADKLIGYLGWMLKIPHLHRVLALPFVPGILANLSAVLPRGPIRPLLERRLRKQEALEASERQQAAAIQVQAATREGGETRLVPVRA